MSRIIRQILSREESWSNWKNEGCNEIKPDEASNRKQETPSSSRKRRAGNDWIAFETNGKHSLGNKELTRLWNLCSDNWTACASNKRIFTPSIEEYFEDIVKEDKDSRMKRVSADSAFTWKALRLLSQKSNHFLAHSNQAVRPVYAYMDSVLDNLSKTLFVNQNQTQVKDEGIEAEDISDEEFLKMPEETNQENESRPVSPSAQNGRKDEDTQVISQDIIDQVKGQITLIWKKLAKQWTFEEDEIEFWESESKDSPSAAASSMLLVWKEQFPETATVSTLKESCLKMGVNLKILEIKKES